MKYLVDTNVISELRKGPRCNPGVAAWFAGVPSGDLYLSVLTVGEIRKGIESLRRRDPPAAAVLEAWLLDVLAVHADRILPLALPVADLWGRFNAAAPLPAIDGLLCATARHHRLTLVTRNVADVARTGVEYLDPFSGPG